MSATTTPVGRQEEARHPAAATLWGMIALMVAMWSVNFVVAKWGLQHLDVFALAAFRVELAAAILGVLWLAERVRKGAGRKLERGDLWTFGYLGFLMVAVNQMCFAIGLKFTTVGHSSLIIAIGPVLVLLLARWQGMERLTLLKVSGLALSFVGVAVLASEHGISLHSGTLRGDLITLAGSVGFACYTVWGKKVAGKYGTLEMTAYNHFAGGLVVLPLAVWQAVKMSREGSWVGVGWQGWLALAYMAGLASVAAYLIYFWALRHLAASRLAAFAYLQPVLATCLGILLVPGEGVTGQLVSGGALVLGGVYLTEVHKREMKPGENDR